MSLLQDTADAIAAVGEGVGLSSPTDSWTGKKVNPPAIEIEIPDVDRHALGAGETQLGANDWTLTFTPRLWLALRDATTSAAKLAQMLEDFVQAFDADPTLGTNFIDDAQFVNARRIYAVDPQQPLIGYEVTLSVGLLV